MPDKTKTKIDNEQEIVDLKSYDIIGKIYADTPDGLHYTQYECTIKNVNIASKTYNVEYKQNNENKKK